MFDAWIAREPTGQYARRACFLYEWLTGNRLGFAGVTSGNYVDAIDHDRYVTAVANWIVSGKLPAAFPALAEPAVAGAAVAAVRNAFAPSVEQRDNDADQ